MVVGVSLARFADAALGPSLSILQESQNEVWIVGLLMARDD
jgi:hypothetical protein